MLRLRLLGPPRVERDGRPVSFDTRKAVALLAVLAVEARPQPRDRLAALLWPDADAVRARSALRRTLSVTVAVAGDAVVADRSVVVLDRDRAWVDVAEFEAAVAVADAASLRRAVDLYRDDFLAGFTLRDAPEFDDWQATVGEAFRRRLAGALGALVDSATADGDLTQAVIDAQRWLSVDALHEPAHRALMRLHAWRGDRAAAIRQYRECVRVLDEELGVEPLQETQELYDALRRAALPAPVTGLSVTGPSATGRSVTGLSVTGPSVTGPSAADAPAVSATAPHIVGRERELAELATVLARTDPTRGCAVVVTGPAGSGRTTMLRLAADSRTDGATVVAARCHPEESGLAFGVAIELVRGVLAAAPEALPQLASPVRAELARLVPETAELVGPAVAGEDPAAPARLYAAVRSLLAAVGGAVHLSIDDAHWLDRASAELLAYLVRRLDGVPLTIVVSWGTDVPVAPVPLSTALSDAVAAGGGAELRLAPLSADDVAQLVGDDPRLRGVDPQRVATATGGLPALVTAWLEAVRRAGPQDESVTDPSAPDAVEDLLRRRITLLSETTQQVLAAAAALGGRVPPEVLRDVSGRGEAETVAAVEEALLAGALVEVAPGGDYDVAFESLRRVVLSSTTVARQRLLHRRAAAALARRAGSGRVTPALAGAVAHHLAAGGREAQAAQWHWRAALEARALHAHDEALAAVRAAVALGHPAAPARVTEGEILIALGRYREALGALELAAAASEPATPEAARVERRLADVHHRLGDYAVADVHLSAALEQAGEAGMSPADLAVMEAERALLAHRLGRREQARCLAAAARQRAGDGVAAAYALNVSGVVATGDGDVDLAEQLFRDSLAASGRAPTDDIAIAALNNLARLLSGAGRHDEALAAAEEALRRGREVGDRHRLAALHTNLADLLRATGDDDAAIAHLKEAAAMFATVDDEQQRRPEIWKLVEW